MISYYDKRYRNGKDPWLFLKIPSTINYTHDDIKKIFKVEIPDHIPYEQYKKYLYEFLTKNEM